jgi:hypothetical protein
VFDEMPTFKGILISIVFLLFYPIQFSKNHILILTYFINYPLNPTSLFFFSDFESYLFDFGGGVGFWHKGGVSWF